MRLKINTAIYSSLVCLSTFSFTALADTSIDRSHRTFTFENDLFSGTDGGYTNGVAYSWAHSGFDTFSEENIPAWIDSLSENLYISTMSGKRRAVGYMVAQGMQTADDIRVEELSEDEAPYAGLLAWRATLYAFDASVSDSLSLMLGIVGPASGAKHTQKFVHRVMGGDDPKGWKYQLENEPVFRLSAEREWKLWHTVFDHGTGLEFSTSSFAGIGNYRSDLGAGVGVRWGSSLVHRLPDPSRESGAESQPIMPISNFSWNVFLKLSGSYVANDIEIDGNTFSSSHSVPLEHVQGVATVGFSASVGRFGGVFSISKETDRYEDQSSGKEFGELSITYRY